MTAMSSQITSLTIVFSTVYSGANQRKHQSSAALAFVLEIHRWPVNSPHKGPLTRKMFPFDDVIMRFFSSWKTFILHSNIMPTYELTTQWTINSHSMILLDSSEYPCISIRTQIARFTGPIWGPPGSCRPEVGPYVGPINLAIREELNIGLIKGRDM